MQLGVVHALLVSGRRAPDVVVGISAGAVNAVTLAEVLQAGNGLEGEAVRDAQVTRFRKLLEEYAEAPGELIRSLRPDMYEIGFRSALRPIELPIHRPEERRERAETLRARAGLVRLLNGLLRIRVTIGDVTRGVRHWLGRIEAAEMRHWYERGWAQVRHSAGLFWLIVVRNGLDLTAPLWLIERQVFRYWLLSTLERAAGKDQGFRKTLVKWLRRREGEEALRIILPSPLLKFCRSIMWLAGMLLFPIPWLVAGVVLAVVSVVPFLRKVAAVKTGPGVTRRGLSMVLASYDIEKDLGDAHFLKQLYVRSFDPSYYGTAQMGDIAESALSHDYAHPGRGELPRNGGNSAKIAPAAKEKKRTLQSYLKGPSPIHIIPVAADLGSGKLEAIPSSTPVVDALMAATAVAPLYRAVEIAGNYYIDGLNVANEPTRALMKVLREQLHRNVRSVEIYPVSPFPLHRTKGCPGTRSRPYTSLVDVVLRALQLRRYRDATLEQRLTNAYNRAMPRGVTLYPQQQPFVSAKVFPIELDRPLELNRKMIKANNDDARRRLALKAVADGCRATLGAIMQPCIQREAQRVPSQAGAAPKFVNCRALLRAHALAGTADDKDPGIPEVCRACAHSRIQRLACNQDQAGWPLWPAAAEKTALATSAAESNGGRTSATTVEAEEKRDPYPDKEQVARRAYQIWSNQGSTHGHDRQDWRQAERELAWPQPRQISGQERPGNDRPLITFLFSGGVFRGVFQLGILNALSELELRPDIVAGSSVGSITGALVAEVFRHKKAKERQQSVASLCASFLGLDRLILTDRFADSVRRFTLRAAQTNFSPRDADEVFRRYDAGSAQRVSRRIRRVVAGLERLLYVSPYELNDLVESCRRCRPGRASDLLRNYAQEFLQRHNVGLELLGAEPLILLIKKHILEAHEESGDQLESLPFSVFAKDGIRLLATATNLDQGTLDVLDGQSPERTFLLDGLLASSAFPGVFRPRWSWEVHSGLSGESQFIDGGVMDNLPVDAVVQKMNQAGSAIKRRPTVNQKQVPHLLFAASLEVNVEFGGASAPTKAARTGAENWVELLKRARRLSYNDKISIYETSQRDLRRIHDSQQLVPESERKGQWEPLNIEVVAVKPEWLCGTFAMHPMLGFRRKRQAASIAHGCASTLARFARVGQKNPDWIDAWGIPHEFMEKFDNSTLCGERTLLPKEHGPGNCCFRADKPCPFSPGQLAKCNPRLLPRTRTELECIYRACCRAETHLR